MTLRAVLLGLLLGGCAIVPQNRRARLADPMLQPADGLDAHRRQKLYTTREAAVGGDGRTEGAGCSCR